MSAAKTFELKQKLYAKFPLHAFRVRRGRGTARRWVYVYTDLPQEYWDTVRDIAAPYAGTFFGDSLPGEEDLPLFCVQVKNLSSLDAP